MRLILALLLFLMSAGFAMAQLIQGSISGVIRDETGAVLPGVETTIANVATGIIRSGITDEAGRYRASSLSVGEYQIRAGLPGFQTTIREGIELTVGRQVIVDLVLQIGEVTEEVTVSGKAPPLDMSTASVSNLVEEEQVLDLPLKNRDLTQLTYLQPGVIKVPRASLNNASSGMGDKLTVAGARGTHNLYLLDGISNSDLSGNTQGSSGSYVGVDTVKEFQIITNNYSAEYRSAPGAIISAVTKSGTNSLHGSVFAFLRNDNLDAANFFANAFGFGKPEFKRSQFGVSLGGPISNSRTFFFASYEGLRENLGTQSVVRVPLRSASDPDTVVFTGEGRKITAAPEIRPYLNLYPLPTTDNFIQDLGNGSVQIASPETQTNDNDFFAVKIDHELGPGAVGSLSGTYNYDHGARSPRGILSQVSDRGTAGSFESLRHLIAVRHTSVISSVTLNQLNVGFSLTEPQGVVPLSTKDFSGLQFVPQRARMGRLRIGSLDSLGFPNEASVHTQKTLTFEDGLSLNRGNHSLKLGASVTRFRYHEFSVSGVNGAYQFRRIRNFLRNEPRRFEALIPPGDDPERNLTQYLFGAYVQDNYRVLPTFTLNLGLRYEFVTVPDEDNGKLANLVNLNDPEPTLGLLYNNATLKSFSPRLGFAWALGQQTSLRAGAGIFYVHPTLYHIRSSITRMPPFTVLGRLDDRDFGRTLPEGKLLFPNAFTEQLEFLRTRPRIITTQSRQETTYMYRWSLTLQQAVGDRWVFSAGYTGSRGLHLWQQSRVHLNRWEGWPNQPQGPKFFPFTLDDLGRLDQTADPIYPNWGDIRIQSPNGNSNYHGLTLGARKRFSRGLSLQASYTYSKAIDQGSGVTATGDGLPDNQRGIYGFDMDEKRGLSSHHIQTYFSANFTYEFPVVQTLSGFVDHLVSGWQINGILTLSDGYPLSITDSSNDQDDIIGDNEMLRVNLIPGGNNNPVLGGPDQYYDVNQFLPSRLGFFGTLGKNTLISPGLASFDFSLFRNFSLAEEKRIQFRAEFFNLFNRANFGGPITSPFQRNTADFLGVGGDGQGTIRRSPSAGKIFWTVTRAREIQFGLKFIF